MSSVLPLNGGLFPAAKDVDVNAERLDAAAKAANKYTANRFTEDPPGAGQVDWEEAEREMVVPAPRFFWLGWLNWLLAFLLFLPALPVIGIVAAITRLSSRGPALFRQMRVGLNGRTFWVYKIRTMSHDAEALTGPVWSPGVADPRITKYGRFLRKSHLDEFPQLFNVLAGDMVLIGPRPERPEFTRFLAQEIPGYVGRLTVKPGITGLAQINLTPDTDLESVRRKLALDLEYITNSNLWTDVRILLCTGLKMFGFPGYPLAKLFRLTRCPSGRGWGAEPSAAVGSRGLHDKQDSQEQLDETLDQTRVDTVAAPLNLRPVSLHSALKLVSGNGDGSVISRLHGTGNGSVTSNANGNGRCGQAAGLSDEKTVASADEDTRIAQVNDHVNDQAIDQALDQAAGSQSAARRRTRSLS